MLASVRTAAVIVGVVALAGAAAAAPRPDILVVTVDAMRADRLSSYGYERETSPNIDRLLASGVRFERAHTVETLTAPALLSMLTGVPPHDHGATRNGLRSRSGLPSLPKSLAAQQWRTAAFVGSWTLKDKLTGLGEHFQDYHEVLTRKRWFGLLNSEATAEDVTDQALDWIGEHRRKHPNRPFFAWLHYVEPHAPYRMHEEFADRLGVPRRDASRSDRYDTEIAAVDHHIGRLLDGVGAGGERRDLLVVFGADHGESLGEHDYWGHGRNLYEPTLHIPMGITWRGHIDAGTSPAMFNIQDLPATLLELLELPAPAEIAGTSLAAVLQGADQEARSTCHQAHKGAVKLNHDSERARSRGLLQVALLGWPRKEVVDLGSDQVELYDLEADPGERRSRAERDAQPSPELQACVDWIRAGLEAVDVLPAEAMDEETQDRLRSLGYLD